jgi:hypothetical protein
MINTPKLRALLGGMGEGTLYMKVKEILVYQMITNIIRFE